MKTKNTYIINLGGSLIAPEAINTDFLKRFRDLIVQHVTNKEQRFVIITGGGKTCRTYQDAADDISADVTDEDKDWIGIHATRLNAQLIRTILADHAFPRINTNPHELQDFYDCKESVMIAAGWKPGFSTDYDTVLLARHLGITKVINLSNISYVYDKDPHKYDDAKKIEEMSWEEFRKMFTEDWKPGMHAPLDPVAAEYAEKEDLEVVTMNGDNLGNLCKYLNDEKFEGSVIRNG